MEGIDGGRYKRLVEASLNSTARGIDADTAVTLDRLPAGRRVEGLRFLGLLEPVIDGMRDLHPHPSFRNGGKRPVADLKRMERLLEGGGDALARWTLARIMEVTLSKDRALEGCPEPPDGLMGYAMDGIVPSALTYHVPGCGDVTVEGDGSGLPMRLEALGRLPLTCDGLRAAMRASKGGHDLDSLYICILMDIHDEDLDRRAAAE